MRSALWSHAPVALVAAGALLFGAARSSAAPAVPVDAGSMAAGAGEELWLLDCAVCHGADARGSSRGPDLDGVGAAGIDFAISTGRMPLGRPDEEARPGPVVYEPAEIRALVGYAGSLVDGPPVPGDIDLRDADVAEGGVTFRSQCASCHQMTGQGGVLTSGRNVPPLTDATPRQILEAIRSGPNDMPVFPATLLDRSTVLDVTAYVQEIQEPEDRGGWSLGHWGPVPEGAAALAAGLIPLVLVARWLGDRRKESGS